MENFQSLIQTVCATFLIFIQTPWDASSYYLWFATLLGGWHYILLVTNNCNLFVFLVPIDEVPAMNWQLHFSKLTAETSMKVSLWCTSNSRGFCLTLCVLCFSVFDLLPPCVAISVACSVWSAQSFDVMVGLQFRRLHVSESSKSLCDVNHACCFNGLGLPY